MSHWSFARFKGNGLHNQLLLPGGNEQERSNAFTQLRAEFTLQRGQVAVGPRLSATLRPLEEPYSAGITLVFSDQRRTFGILILLRTSELGPFTSAEIHALVLALDSAADRLSGLAIAEPQSGSPSKTEPAETPDAPS